MTNTIYSLSSKDGISVKGYRGDGAVLLAYDLDEHLTQNLAGFAIKCTPPKGKPYYLLNRLNFTKKMTSATTPEQRTWTPSNEAPFQKFKWVHFPSNVLPGNYDYEVSAMYFSKGGLKTGPSSSVSMEKVEDHLENFELGFTRGYISSQAYAEKFKNAEIRPKKKTIDFDTKKYAKQYEWLGFHARKMVFDFLKECLDDKNITVDLFAYDLDEPDFVKGLAKLGGRLRAVLDDASLHTKKGALEIDAKAIFEESAGTENVKIGHFTRFAHDKILIQKKRGKPVKVLTGSANFSVRGLYVQANNVLIFDHAPTAELYEEAFNEAFDNMKGFKGSHIANGWFDIGEKGLPDFSVSFSPHKTAGASLDKVADAVKKADTSVLFAVMQLGGGGPVLKEIRELPSREGIFSYGVTQSDAGVNFFKPGQKNGVLVPFSYLTGNVPAPFREEWSGGIGQVIHHKFVVVDFNDLNPVVFAGSSNLAEGGEENNGDNLLAIYNPTVVTAYAIEAIRLIDHYHFRVAMKDATKQKPLNLQSGDSKAQNWWEPYYDKENIKNYERLLFAR